MSFGYAYGDLESEVLAASPIGLVRLLYKGALEAVASARHHLQSGDIPARSRAITKAQQIVAHLGNSLTPEGAAPRMGSDVSRRLSELYAFVQDCLARANFRQVEQPLLDAQRVLKSLEAAWSELDPARTIDMPFVPPYDAEQGQRSWIG